MPKISVLMPAFNASRFIKEAIDSVLNQTFDDFELIILNDGSTDETQNIIKNYADGRIIYLENDQNRGLAFTRNRLLKASTADFIAWLDADDKYLPTILEKSYQYLINNQGVAMVGSWAKIIDEKGLSNGASNQSYATISDLPIVMFFVNYLTQSSVLIRKDCAKNQLFDPRFPVILDFELWNRIIENHPIAILKEVLVEYRIHGNNMSITDTEPAMKAIKLMYEEKFGRYQIPFSAEEIDLHYQISFSEKDKNSIEKGEIWLLKLKNYLENYFPNPNLDAVFSHRWIRFCLDSTRFEKNRLFKAINSKLFKINIRNLALVLIYFRKIIK